MQNLPLLRLMNLVSPAFPVGAYAYSQGQEWAVESGWVKGESEVEDWIYGICSHNLCRLELPCLSRIYSAWENDEPNTVNFWNHFLAASRETHELLLEDQQLGFALNRILLSLGEDRQQTVLDEKPSFVTLFALCGVIWNIPSHELKLGFLWSWLENQVSVATKIVPLGQTQAQQMLSRLMEKLPLIIELADQFEDDDIGLGLPAFAIASAQHERQYSRLFRS